MGVPHPIEQHEVGNIFVLPGKKRSSILSPMDLLHAQARRKSMTQALWYPCINVRILNFYDRELEL